MSRFGRELMESANEALAIAEGRAEPAGTIVVSEVGAVAETRAGRRIGIAKSAFIVPDDIDRLDLEVERLFLKTSE